MPPDLQRGASGRRPKKKPRTLENTVSEIANRPAPIRRSIFDLLDTLIASRERPDAGLPDAEDAPAAQPPARPRTRQKRKDRAPENPESR